MRSILVSALMLDYNLYPRHVVDEQHVHYIVEAMRSGAEMPPVVADKRSKRVIDGFHRVTAVKKMHGDSQRHDFVTVHNVDLNTLTFFAMKLAEKRFEEKWTKNNAGQMFLAHFRCQLV